MISSRHRCSAPELAPLPLTAAFKRSFPRITEVLLIQGVVRSRAGRRRGKVTELLKVEWKEKHCAEPFPFCHGWMSGPCVLQQKRRRTGILD